MSMHDSEGLWQPIRREEWMDRAREFLARMGQGPAGEMQAEQMLAEIARTLSSPGLPGRDRSLAEDLKRALEALRTEEGRRELERLAEDFAFQPFEARGIDPIFSFASSVVQWGPSLARWLTGSREGHECLGGEQPLLVEIQTPKAPMGILPILVVVPLKEAPRVVDGCILCVRPWGSDTPLRFGGKVRVSGLVWPLSPEDWSLWSQGAERAGDLFQGMLF